MVLCRGILKLMSLLVGVLSMMLAGSFLIFTVYTNVLKKTYGYTQSELELMSAIGNIGFSIGCVPGVLIERFQPRSASLLALILSTGGYLLLWSATLSKSFYHNLAPVQYIYFFLACWGGICSYMAAMIPNITNFKPRVRGTIVSILDGGLSAGAAIFVAIYGAYFVNGHVTDEENQDIQGFFLTMAIVSAVINGLGIVFLGYYKDVTDIQVTSSESENLVNVRIEPSVVADVTGFELLKNWDFQFLNWVFILESSIQMMFINNMSVYLKSFSMEQENTTFNVLIPVCGVLAKLMCGIISDTLIRIISRPSLLLIFNVAQTAAFFVCIFYASNYYALLVITIVTGLANGAVWSTTPTLLSEYFGTQYFGRNWGCTLMGNAIAVIVVQKVYAVIYEAQVTTVGDTFCYGDKCFILSSIMIAVMSACAVLLNIGLIERRRALNN